MGSVLPARENSKSTFIQYQLEVEVKNLVILQREVQDVPCAREFALGH